MRKRVKGRARRCLEKKYRQRAGRRLPKSPPKRKRAKKRRRQKKEIKGRKVKIRTS